MARRRPNGLGSTACKKPVQSGDGSPIERCGSTKKLTLCVGDRVSRLPVGGRSFKESGTVMGVQMGADNKGRKQLSARICFDGADPGDVAYPFLFSELKKAK